MANGAGGGVVVSFFKMLFGDVPAQWIRLVLFGVGATFVAFTLRDFARDVRAESTAVRGALIEYIASNKAWQEASMTQREQLLRKVNGRIARLYRQHRMEYEPVEP